MYLAQVSNMYDNDLILFNTKYTKDFTDPPLVNWTRRLDKVYQQRIFVELKLNDNNPHSRSQGHSKYVRWRALQQ